MEEDIKEILTALDNTTKKQLDEAIANADKEWSEMELEEDIKILEEFIKDLSERYLDTIVCDEEKLLQAIQHLIARNKKLEEENKTITDEYMIQKHLINADFLEDYIPKSKLREIVALYNNTLQCTRKYNQELADILCDLEELLED